MTWPLRAVGWGAAGAARTALLRRRPVRARVRGSSMAPTLVDGARVWAIARRHYRVGDVVVFVAGPRGGGGPTWRIKRVLAVAGEPAPPWMPGRDRSVPTGHLVVVGDNPVSQGSRQLGYVPVTAVLGRVRV